MPKEPPVLAAALLEQGHRRFAVLRGPGTVVTAADRTTGFVSALEQSGVEPVVVIETTFDRDGGFDGDRQLVRQGLAGSDPLCVFATNEVMAIGAMAAFREAGLDIPQDVQVAGFDDIPTLRSRPAGSLPRPDHGPAAVGGDGPAHRRDGHVDRRPPGSRCGGKGSGRGDPAGQHPAAETSLGVRHRVILDGVGTPSGARPTPGGDRPAQ
jgi:hypothetical protein